MEAAAGTLPPLRLGSLVAMWRVAPPTAAMAPLAVGAVKTSTIDSLFTGLSSSGGFAITPSSSSSSATASLRGAAPLREVTDLLFSSEVPLVEATLPARSTEGPVAAADPSTPLSRLRTRIGRWVTLAYDIDRRRSVRAETSCGESSIVSLERFPPLGGPPALRNEELRRLPGV